MLALGTPAPDFSLPDVVSGNTVSLDDFAEEKALLVIFLCAHCPYVHHVQPELARIGRDYAGQSLGIVAITSNDISEYPQDAPEPTARFAREAGFNFPVCYDETQAVAKAYTAACTPDFFLFDPERTLRLSRPDRRFPPDARRQPPRTRHPQWRGPARGDRRRAARRRRLHRATAEHRLQHQVEAGQRAELLPALLRICAGSGGKRSFFFTSPR